ncbi:MAG TPA: tetratricopeptide repeat protein [Stellaceae bacterium]|nr:tetratricopeptide repeat protein [Stellaceae bacterium]
MRFGMAVRRGLALAAVLAGLAACADAGRAPDSADAASKPMSALGSYLAARHAQDQHDYTDAARFMDRALVGDPDNLELARRTFVLRVSEGQISEAVPLARRLIEIEPKSGLAGLVLLTEAIKDDKFDEAARLAAAMPREGAERFAMPLLDAWIALGRQNPEAAQKSLDQIGSLRGLEQLRDLHLALIDDYADRVEEAASAYKRLVAGEAQPTWRVIEVAGNFFERHGGSAEAGRLYERYAASDTETDAAATGLQRIAAGTVPPRIIATPRQGAAEALFDLASLLNRRETIDAALIYVRLCLELEPRFALAQLLAGEIREEQNRTPEALALYRSVDPASPLYWASRLRVALALDALDQTDEAKAELQKMADERPMRPEPLVELGDILRGHNQFAEAVRAYDAAVARLATIDKSSWRILYARGVALERSNQWARAEADLKRALELEPDQPLVLNYLGYSWIDKGENLSEALKMIERAVQLRPRDGYIVDSLGWAFYRLGNMSKATELLEHAIELLPEDPTINDHLGDVYWRTGRPVEARYQWRRALLFGPEAQEGKNIELKLNRGLGEPATVSGG